MSKEDLEQFAAFVGQWFNSCYVTAIFEYFNLLLILFLLADIGKQNESYNESRSPMIKKCFSEKAL